MAIHSDWGDWLPRSIAAANPTGITAWYLGCNGLALKDADGTTIFVDPYLGTGDPPRTVRMIPVPFDPEDVEHADAVFATHEHTDHVHGPSQAPILANTEADFYGPDASIAVTQAENWIENWAVPPDQLTEVAESETVNVGEFTVSVEPASDPDADHPVAYVFEHPVGTLLHGGDARPSEAFETIGRNYDIDVGILAFGSAGLLPDKETGELRYTRWYSDEADVVEAAYQLRVDRLVPTHWDMWKGLTADPMVLIEHARSLPFPDTVQVVEIGEAFVV